MAALWAEVKVLSAANNNFATLRNAIKNASPPLIPYLGISFASPSVSFVGLAVMPVFA